MNRLLKIVLGVTLASGAREGVQQAIEVSERKQVFEEARLYSDIVGKPLIVIGAPKAFWDNHPGGDVTIDINPNVKTRYPYLVADVRDIPFPTGSFGAAYCSHVLEHLHTVEDAEQALNEMYRVADKVFIVSPHKSSILAWLHPEHHLWVLPAGDGYIIEGRDRPTIKRYVSALGNCGLNQGGETIELASTILLPPLKQEEMEMVMQDTTLMGRLALYHELRADVRWTGQHYPIRELVQPAKPEVREVAQVLAQAKDFVGAAQEFVDSFTTYQHEEGDLWRTPADTLAQRAGDCDCKAILLCSILRNYIPAEKVFCAFGTWAVGGKEDGHMWVVMEGEGGKDRIIESTAHPGRPIRGDYKVMAIFNDKYAFATKEALSEFDLQPAGELVPVGERRK